MPGAALHLSGGQRTMPAVHRASDTLWFASGESSGVFSCVGRNNKKHHQRRPAGERGHLLMEVSCEALLHSEQSEALILQPSQALQAFVESALLLKLLNIHLFLQATQVQHEAIAMRSCFR